MSTPPLSARINLEQSRKQAKDLVKAFKAGDAKSLDRIRWNHQRFRGLKDAEIAKRPFNLADAQHVIARLHYFDSWPKLLHHIEALEQQDPRVMRFENAADAIIAGDVPKIRELLRAHPGLIRERATRAHGAPLLHYISANGVEDYRQISPPNIVEVAKILLDAGAEVDAESEAYGGGSKALGLVATSTPPRVAGVQIPLIDLLLEYGAVMDGEDVRAALANGCPEAAQALVDRGAKVDSVVEAAALCPLDLVKRMAGSATRKDLEKALAMAARYGTYDVLEYLLELGVDVSAPSGMSPLHQAAGRADLEMVKMLIERGAPLEMKNAYGGTVLDSTLWFAHHARPEEFASRDYPGVIDALIAAGAKTDLYPEMEANIDNVYRRAGKKRRAR